MGSMDLAGFGSADIEQLLQGAEIQELYGNQLLMAAGGAEGPQGSSLLRLMEAPGRLQQLMAAASQGSSEAGSTGSGGEAEQHAAAASDDEAFADAEEAGDDDDAEAAAA